MTEHLSLVSDIDGGEVSREAVLQWEHGRAQKVLKLLGAADADQSGDVDDLRNRLLELKRQIGPVELEQRLKGRLRFGNTMSVVAARLVGGKRVASSVKIRVPVGTAEGFAAWFNEQSELPYSEAMLAACPDHYFIGYDDLGRQKVVETTGGSPAPTRFFVDYQDISSLTTPASPAYPVQIAGVARDDKGLAIGGVRHQFRNLADGGFESWNTVEFPSIVGRRLVDGHRWHLACEFSNWIEFYRADASGDDSLG